MNRLYFTLVAIFAFVQLAEAQSYHLTLNESVEVAKEKSFNMKRLKEDFVIAEQNLIAAKARLRTHVDMDLTIPNYSKDVRTFTQKEGDVTKYYNYMEEVVKYSGNLVITQPLPTNGRLYLNTGVAANHYLPNSYNGQKNLRNAPMNITLGFNQPLDALYGYNDVKEAIRRAKLAHEQSSKSLKREELNLIYNVSRSFYNLLSRQKRAEIAKLDLERQTDAFEVSRKKFAAGLIKEVDHLQMEVDLAEAHSSYEIATLDQVSDINSFKEMLGLELSAELTLSSDMSYRDVVIDPQRAVDYALKNRLEIREQEINIELQKINIKQQKSERLIKGSIEGNFGRVSTTQLDTVGFSDAFRNSYEDFKDRSRFMVGLKVSIPIFDWGENRAKVRASQARMRQNVYRKEEVERSIEVEVRNLVANLGSTLKRLHLLEKNVAVAEKSFEIMLSRFNDAEIDSQSLFLERNRLNNAYISHLSAYITYQLSLADIMRKTFYDFENDVAIE